MKRLFNDNWKFQERPLQEGFAIADADQYADNWMDIELPHDWLITRVKALYRDSEGWYQKNFSLSSKQAAETVLLNFDGIYMDSSIYVNGVLVQHWPNGTTPQLINISDQVHAGINNVFVRARFQAPNARWYTGAGIYRNVWIFTLPNTYCPPYGSYCHANAIERDAPEKNWQLTFDTELVQNDAARALSGSLYVTLSNNRTGAVVKTEHISLTNLRSSTTKTWVIEQPCLWSPEDPALYTLTFHLQTPDGDQKWQEIIGFRQLIFTPDHGCRLNGEPFKIHGVCQHGDYGALGGAVHRSAIQQRFKLLKGMGVNAIRTAHNPFSEEFLTQADQLGFLVLSEFTDVWKNAKTQYDYARFFASAYKQDVRMWIRRDRNHPCVLLWSIGNEISDTHIRNDGKETAEHLVAEVNRYDPLRNAQVTFASNYLAWTPTQKVADAIGLVGYNYGEQLYAQHHREHPTWCIYGSETVSVAASRGVYHFPLKEKILADDDLQCSALGNSVTSWGTQNLEQCLLDDLDTPYSAGQFVWSGFDYIGEPTPYHTKNSYLGQIDTAGLQKDSYWVFQAAWIPFNQRPIIHLFPYWDFNIGQLIDVRVATNAPECELFLNGESLGRRLAIEGGKRRLLQDWQVPYVPGRLIVKAYDDLGKVVAEDQQVSFGDAEKLELKSNKLKLDADGQSLAYIHITARDIAGNRVANANNKIKVTIAGPGRLLGLDNGDSTDTDEYFGDVRYLFNGSLVAIVSTTTQAGEITVTAASPNLPSAEISITSQQTAEIAGISLPVLSAPDMELGFDIPIRKLELIPKNGELPVVLNQQQPERHIVVKALPKNTTQHEHIWRVTDDKGINTTIASLESTRSAVKLTAKTNGVGNLRCGTTNGRSHMAFYSSLPISVVQHRPSYLDPYNGVSGGLYTHSNVALTPGNERGIATLRDKRSEVTFENVNFGPDGSSTLSLSLFSMEARATPIEVWRGTPNEKESELLAKLTYTKGSIWNTYQVQTFVLPRRFRGIETLSLVFHDKVHIKEFRFAHQRRAFSVQSILDADDRYGDQFKVENDKISNIGNNVTFAYHQMNFGKKGATALTITGAAAQDNAIEVKVSKANAQAQTVDMLTFPASADETSYTFSISKIVGKADVEFIFLPGSNFEFKSFRFEE